MLLETNDYYTMKQAAAIMKVTRQTIYNWIKAGKSPKFYLINGTYLFDKASVESRRREA